MSHATSTRGRIRRRAYRLRAYPTQKQKDLLAQCFGNRRWVWNQTLELQLQALNAGEKMPRLLATSKMLTAWRAEREWLALSPRCMLDQALRDLDKAWSRCFGGSARRPRFKSKHQPQSMRVTLDERQAARRMRWEGGTVCLPGLGTVKTRGGRKAPTMPKMATVSRDGTGKYWVAYSVEEHVESIEAPRVAAIGVDLGVAHTATTSEGEHLDAPKAALDKADAAVRKLSQRLCRQRKGSGRRRRTKHRLAVAHQRVRNLRADHCHKASRTLVGKARVLCVETLAVKNMVRSARGSTEKPGRNVRQKSGLNRAMHNATLGELRRQLAYKADWYGRTVVEVDRWFPSSKLCSVCGAKYEALGLRERRWTCTSCGAVHDRDVNAAVNLRNEGLRLYEQDMHPEAPGVRTPLAERGAEAARRPDAGRAPPVPA